MGDKEKKAISEAEKSAEQIRSKIVKIKEMSSSGPNVPTRIGPMGWGKIDSKVLKIK